MVVFNSAYRGHEARTVHQEVIQGCVVMFDGGNSKMERAVMSL